MGDHKFNKEHYHEIRAMLPQEYKIKVQLAAAKSGCKSIAEFIRKCIDDVLESDPQE